MEAGWKKFHLNKISRWVPLEYASQKSVDKESNEVYKRRTAEHIEEYKRGEDGQPGTSNDL